MAKAIAVQCEGCSFVCLVMALPAARIFDLAKSRNKTVRELTQQVLSGELMFVNCWRDKTTTFVKYGGRHEQKAPQAL